MKNYLNLKNLFNSYFNKPKLVSLKQNPAMKKIAELTDEISFAITQDDFVYGIFEDKKLIDPVVSELEFMLIDVYSLPNKSQQINFEPLMNSAVDIIKSYYAGLD